jgi:STE24 endopeptidase
VANEDRSTRYQRLRRRAVAATALVDGALLVGVVTSGLARALTDALSATGMPAPVAIAAFVLALAAARTVLILPIAFVVDVVVGRRYGRMPPSPFRWATGFLGRAVVLAAALTGAALVIRLAAWWSPPNWWAWAAVVLSAAALGAAAAVPALAASSASGVVPLGRTDLEARLTALARRAGAPGVRVFQWRVGRLGSGTALLVGMGPSRRILVADTVLDTHSDDEVEVIVAHELAHHRRADAWWSAAAAAGACALGLYAAARVLPMVGGAFSLAGPSDTAALPLMALVAGGVAAAVAPLVNLVSRAQERRADRDALAWTGNAPALVRTLRRLSAEHLTEERPTGWAAAFLNSHPGVAERIAAAESWGAANSQFTIHDSQTAGREPRA